MDTNILVALRNIMDIDDNKLIEIYKDDVNNRANSVGDALEFFVKDLFCSSLNTNDFGKKDLAYNKYLSYTGNAHNPPDFIIKKSSAVEVKKVEGLTWGDIALNSSYPKDFLYKESTLISNACRECEDEYGGWQKKEMIYAIGNVVNQKLRVFWLLDGECYCADKSVYKKIKATMQNGIKTINGVEFVESKELGRVKKIDPLGITDLRIRGMWSIKHPMKTFDYLVNDYKKENELTVYCLLLKSKYDKISKSYKDNLKKYIDNGELEMEDVKVKNPNNPAKLLDAVLFKVIFQQQED